MCHAQQARADEEIRQNPAGTRRLADELFQSREALFQRHRGGAEPADQSVYEKSLRLPQLRAFTNFSFPYTWRSTRTRIHPQILLKSLRFKQLINASLGL